MAKQNLGGVYANMDFPPYVWQEYPKHVITGPHGQYQVVNDAKEEAELKQTLQKEQDDAPPEPIHFVADPAKEILISRAHELGVSINRKWSIAKLQATISQAEKAMDDLPAEGDEVEAEVEILPMSSSRSTIEPAEVDDKETLIAQAKELGVDGKNFHLWGIPRLKAAIAEAKLKA